MKNLQEIPRLNTRTPFAYVEHAKIHIENNNILVLCPHEKYEVPLALLNALVLGPGTSITHEAIKLLYENNVQVLWMGGNGVIFYAQGIGGTYKSDNILKQALAYADLNERDRIARKMFQMRFNENVSDVSIEDLRLKEGLRVKKLYEDSAKEFGVNWNGRTYSSQGDTVNSMLTIANASLYSICHAVISTTGYSTAIAFVHTGHMHSFIFDIADLYKADYTIRLAFETASMFTNKKPLDLLRERFIFKAMNENLTDQIIKDIEGLFRK